jgi:formylglycine-generating enzyme required for sulfatase activity
MADKDGMVMVYVPVGEFLMGSTDSDPMTQDDEKPQHTVYLDAFWIDRTEVTNAQYKKCVSAGACRASSYANDSQFNGDNQPVVGMDWNDAQAYCQWAGRQLPTEAQWEKAARGADGRIYPWGNQPATCEYAVMDDVSGNGCGKGHTAWPVGSKPKGVSPYGALDMAGNVWEWVADWYDDKYYANSPSRNPQGPSSGQFRVMRGASLDNDPTCARAACRYSRTPVDRGNNFGFRCVGVEPGG